MQSNVWSCVGHDSQKELKLYTSSFGHYSGKKNILIRISFNGIIFHRVYQKQNLLVISRP